MEIQIREFDTRDSVSELTRLIHAGYASVGQQGFNFPAVDQTEEKTAERVAHGICLVAEVQGTLIGTILVRGPFREAPSTFLVRDDVACCMQFAVHPDWQQYGVGTQLMAQAEALAAAAGYAYLAFDTAAALEGLVAYYERIGFQRTEEMQWPGKNYRSVVMSKRLAPRPAHRAGAAS